MLVYETEDIEVITQVPTTTSDVSTESVPLVDYNDSITNWYDAAHLQYHHQWSQRALHRTN